MPPGALDQHSREWLQAGLVSHQRLQELLGVLGGQGVELELGVISLVPPAMPVLGAVVDEEEHAGGRQALHHAVEEGLGLGVEPVQVLEQPQHGLYLALPHEQAFDGVQDALAALRRIERLPVRVLDRHVQERQEGWQRRRQGLIQCLQVGVHLLADASRIITTFDLEIGLQQLDHGQERGGLTVGDRAAFEPEPAFAKGLGELPEQAGLAHAGLTDDGRHLPMPQQNAKPGGFSKSQCGQRGLSVVPQRPQKFMPSGFSKPQLGQCLRAPSGTAVRVVGASG